MADEQPRHDDDDALEALIRAGGRRLDPPADAYRAVFAAAEAALRDKVNRRRWWRVGAWLGVAAATVLGVLALGLDRSTWRAAPPSVPIEVARVDRLNGTVEWHEQGSRSWAVLKAPGGPLPRGATLRTRDGTGVGLVYPDASSLRIGPNAEIELTDAWHVQLRQGTVFVGTAPEVPGPLEVVTALGRVRHVGTQFEVRYEPPGMRVRVREGRVAVAGQSVSTHAAAGEELAIDATGAVDRRAFASDDPAWRWAELLAPVPRFDGRSAQALLEWAAREMGRELVYARPSVAQRAASVIVHGEPGPLAPAEVLQVMLATTDLRVDASEGARLRVYIR
jgi:ferric-dicitrate binding protein FerR (iron transport regulator)